MFRSLALLTPSHPPRRSSLLTDPAYRIRSGAGGGLLRLRTAARHGGAGLDSWPRLDGDAGDRSGLVALPYDRDSVLGHSGRRRGFPIPTPGARQHLRRISAGPSPATPRRRSGSASSATRSRWPSMSSTRWPRHTSLQRALCPVRAAADSIGSRRGATRRPPTMHSTRLARRSSRRARASGPPFGNGKIAPIEGTTASCTGCLRGREAVTDTTGADGWAHLRIKPGRWWIYARSWDATDRTPSGTGTCPPRETRSLLRAAPVGVSPGIDRRCDEHSRWSPRAFGSPGQLAAQSADPVPLTARSKGSRKRR